MIVVRKWVAGGVALVVVGVSTYLLLQPRKGSVEYHKSEYLRLWNSRSGLDRWIMQKSTRQIVGWRLRQNSKYREFHVEALKELGYLETGVFVVSNRPGDLIEKVLDGAFGRTNMAHDFIFIGECGSNTLTVVHPHEERHLWQQVVSEADAKQSKELSIYGTTVKQPPPYVGGYE